MVDNSNNPFEFPVSIVRSETLHGCLRRITTTAILLLCISSLVTVFCGCSTLENKIIYAPSVYPNNWNSIEDHRIKEVHFATTDSHQIHGLLAHHPNPRAVVLFAHGRQGNVTTPIKQLTSFADRHQVSVLIFDYRGYGKSSGRPDENGLYEDARAARRFLAHTYQMPESEIILMGRSLGAAVAIELAANDGAKALIIECGFTSLPELVKHYAPPLPSRAILTSRFDSLSKLKNFYGPAIFSHGTDDKVIPFEHGQRLYAAANGPKRFVSIEGCGHDSEPPAYYVSALNQFIGDVTEKR